MRCAEKSGLKPTIFSNIPIGVEGCQHQTKFKQAHPIYGILPAGRILHSHSVLTSYPPTTPRLNVLAAMDVVKHWMGNSPHTLTNPSIRILRGGTLSVSSSSSSSGASSPTSSSVSSCISSTTSMTMSAFSWLSRPTSICAAPALTISGYATKGICASGSNAFIAMSRSASESMNLSKRYYST